MLFRSHRSLSNCYFNMGCNLNRWRYQNTCFHKPSPCSEETVIILFGTSHYSTVYMQLECFLILLIYSSFFTSHSYITCITTCCLSFYIACLHTNDFKYTILRTHISTISFFHKLHALPDPTNSLAVQESLIGHRNIMSNTEPTKLLPITKPLLHQLLHMIPFAISLPYYRILYKSLLLLADYLCLRAGEIVLSNTGIHTITIGRVKLSFLTREFTP